GFYDEAFTLEIETEGDYEVFYTLDGSTPNAQSHKYEGPIEISKELMYSIPLISNEKTSGTREGFLFNPIDIKSGISFKAVTSYKASRSVPRVFSQPTSTTYIFDDELKNNVN